MGAATPAGGPLGAALTAAREAAGLSVEDVSARTRLRATVIRDLESDRITSSGGAVYARGHVKSICAALGTEPAPYLAVFSQQYGAEPAVPLGPSEPVEQLHGRFEPRLPTAARPERRGPNWTAAGVTAAAALIGVFVVGQVVAPEPSAVEAGADASATPAARKPAARPAAPRNLTAARPPVTGAELRVRLLGGDSWVSVRNAGRTLYEGVLRSGDVRDFRDPSSLRVVLGNAGAVNLVCSGRDLGPAGTPGQVRRFTCTVRGIRPT